MKKLTLIFSLAMFIMLSPLQLVQAQEDYGYLFISVGDAIMKVKANDWESAEKLISQLSKDWEQVEYSKSGEAEKVEQSILKLSKLVKNREAEPMLEALSDVSHRLVAFEEEQNPDDQEEQREKFLTTLTPILEQLKQQTIKVRMRNINYSYHHGIKMRASSVNKALLIMEKSKHKWVSYELL